MKKIVVIVVSLVAAVAVRSQAQTNAFRVSINGTLTLASGEKNFVADVAPGVSILVTNLNNVLVAIVDQTHRGITVAEVNPANGNVVRVIMTSVRWFSDSKGKFDTNLEVPLGPPAVFQGDLSPMNGDLEFIGQFKSKNNTMTSISAKIIGVWLDSSFPATENLPSAQFRGTMKSSGATRIPDNYVYPNLLV